MSVYNLLGVALGLAMDAFAVAVAASVAIGRITPRQVFRLSWHFGLFQALMPVLGWAAGTTFVHHVQKWDHWAAWGLLTAIGIRAIAGALTGQEDTAESDPTRGMSLVMLSFATSMDALAVGLGFAMLDMSIWVPVAMIGIVAASMTMLGMLLGGQLGEAFGRKMEVAGGTVLIGIGFKILLEHLLA